ncbi:MAG: DMT family transporter [Hyphomicrobiaceae bacterium]|nr:DMT family transporter [Hyphomicrobiaceae bacterium]
MADRAQGRATLIGMSAVVMWSTLGLFTAASGAVPPLQMNAIAFAVSGGLSVAFVAARHGWGAVFPKRKAAFALMVCGLFGYHALYFAALRNAPPVTANLLNYLWPLLIVVFSGLLPGERLKAHHLAGAGLGFVGAALLVTGGEGLSLGGGHLFGILCAVGAALFWSSYSVLSRRFADVPSTAVSGACLVTALLSIPAHLAFEQTLWPANGVEWAASIGTGLLPVGLAFFVWDHGCKHGDIRVLGASAYAAPILSTLLLIGFGFGAFTGVVVAACLLVTAGALLASKDMLFSARPAGAG